AAEEFKRQIDIWHHGRDESTSRRSPHVGCLLEYPLLQEQNEARAALLMLEIAATVFYNRKNVAALRVAIDAYDERMKVERGNLLKRDRALRFRFQKLADYLESFAPLHAYDALCYGMKKNVLAGDPLPVEEIEPETEDREDGQNEAQGQEDNAA
ncbi:MAG: hypothetical protein VX834_01430, partial [Myxococcota bacterium]|nr:hypothetical protein [Myxococcota bacterium]